MRRSFFSDRSFKFILGGLVFLFVLLIIQKAYVQPPPPPTPIYTISAHGNTSYGVNRPRTSIETGFGYSRGNCAHCHEQHASIGGSVITAQDYALFYADIEICDLFCYRCHNATGAEMQVNNYLYGISFGGYTPLIFSGIYSHFCSSLVLYTSLGSRHHLTQIYNNIKNNAAGWGFPADPGFCSPCHNPHLAKRIGATQYHSPYDPSKSPITRPSEHYNNPLNLWGDDASERMDQYASSVGGHYLAPYYGSGFHDPITGPFEPAGNSTSNGSNLPDYVTFCMDCHQYALVDPERGNAPVKAIVWGINGDKHGGRPSGGGTNCGVWESGGDLRAPYDNTLKEAGYNYVLSCTDCHEPHGSPNRRHLIRRFVNGEAVAAEIGVERDDWRAICQRCHTPPAPVHNDQIACSMCHKHGAIDSWCCCSGNYLF